MYVKNTLNIRNSYVIVFTYPYVSAGIRTPDKVCGSVTYLTYPADEFTYLTYELRILRMDNVYSADAYVYFIRSKILRFSKFPLRICVCLRIMPDWITDGYGCLRMIRILADAYGFLSVSIRSYRKWPCDCSIKASTSVKVLLRIKPLWSNARGGFRIFIKRRRKRLCVRTHITSAKPEVPFGPCPGPASGP